MPRNVFLEGTTLALGGVIGVLVTLPVLGFTIGPAFLKQGQKNIDLGPIDDYPEGEFLITTFTSRPGRRPRLAPDGLRPQQRLPRQAAELHDPLEPLRAPRLPGAAERRSRSTSRPPTSGRA